MSNVHAASVFGQYPWKVTLSDGSVFYVDTGAPILGHCDNLKLKTG